MHDKDTKRYQAQMEHLDKNGYFMMADGSKSSDYKEPKSKKRAQKNEEKPEKAKFDFKNLKSKKRARKSEEKHEKAKRQKQE